MSLSYSNGSMTVRSEFMDFYNTGTDLSVQIPSDDHVAGEDYIYSTTLSHYDVFGRLEMSVSRREAYGSGFDDASGCCL